MDAARRKEVIAELTSNGYAASYIDSWPPKVTLYRHKPGLNQEGTICSPVGSAIPNQPGHPDHVARKSRLGWLPWLPSETCKCRACRESREVAAAVEPAQPPEGFALKCRFCEFVAKGAKPQGLANKLKGHVKREHAKEAVAA